eukprot:scaffold228098_cov36-Tisochrysis_lutea.AAC.5
MSHGSLNETKPYPIDLDVSLFLMTRACMCNADRISVLAEAVASLPGGKEECAREVLPNHLLKRRIPRKGVREHVISSLIAQVADENAEVVLGPFGQSLVHPRLPGAEALGTWAGPPEDEAAP